MVIDSKTELKRKIITCLQSEQEIQKIVLFGSFLTAPAPNDIDFAIFQDSDEGYLSLALKYRKMMRDIAKEIPLDIFPLKAGEINSAFLTEVEQGEVVYEK